MAYQDIEVQQRGVAAWITLNRPDALNAMTPRMLRELEQAALAAAADSAVAAVVFTGAGRAFCAGADLAALKDLQPPHRSLEMLGTAQRALRNIENLAKPTIAAINGVAVAGGLELILVCDLAVAADTARIGDGHLNYGLIPGGGASQRLPRLVGAQRAKELLFTGRLIAAAEAERIGLVNRVVPAAELVATVDALVVEVAAKSPLSLAGVKLLVNRGLESDLAAGLELETQVLNNHLASLDAQEGLRAFAEKRRPEFRGV